MPMHALCRPAGGWVVWVDGGGSCNCRGHVGLGLPGGGESDASTLAGSGRRDHRPIGRGSGPAAGARACQVFGFLN